MRCSHTAFSPTAKLVFAWLTMGLAGSLFGGNPYQTIPERNAFHLRPPAAVQTEEPHAPLPLVRLTGITTLLGKRALLKVDFPAKPREKPKEESYILAEGQRAGPIEVLSIDEKTAHVKLDELGTITNVTFEKITPGQKAARVQPVYPWTGQRYRRVYR